MTTPQDRPDGRAGEMAGDAAEPQMGAPIEVTLLTQPDCALCDHAKQVLARVGADHRLRVVEVDLASPQGRRLAAGAGLAFPPGILLDGKPFGYGRLSERKLRRTLQQTRAPS